MRVTSRTLRFCQALALASGALAGIALSLPDLQAGQEPARQATPANLSPIAAHQAAGLFQSSDNCLACHNNLTTPAGEDVSIGASWRASMMANSSRDPYWQAAVRREMLDHPQEGAAIEDECSICHMPMATTLARAAGAKGRIFAHLPAGQAGANAVDLLAHDGVSCTVCHQITDRNLGSPESFTGGFVIGPGGTAPRQMFGPFQIDRGRTSLMRSATGVEPAQGAHVSQSEMCATCHTLFTHALDRRGQVIGKLAEQAMYLEWRHSSFAGEQQSCQSCHMPTVADDTPIVSVLGEPRAGLSRHTFVGGNFFMLRMLNRYRDELGVVALPHELELAATRTVQNLQAATAALSIGRAEVLNGRLGFDVLVRNLTGHKLPTAYPSRRVWLHVTVRDRTGRSLFESGAIAQTGRIQGNDNDADAGAFEPHHLEIRDAGQVQIYESMMVDGDGAVTTGLLSGARYIKDNRLLPRGFDKTTAETAVAVHGAALSDPDFTGGTDRVRFSVDVGQGAGPFEIDVALRFQTISYRWAENLKPYDSFETRRFVSYYESMSAVSSEVLVRAQATSN
jgi:hypothetical protein